MFERFSQEARQVVVFAQEEARALNHSYIGTEHILLGVLRGEEQAGGEQPLHSLGVTLEDVRRDVRRIVGGGAEPTEGMIPFTPRAKKVLELALREALSLGHNWIGPEHILLGISRENEGVASRILLDFDADPENLRKRVVEMLPAKASKPVVPYPGHQMARRPLEADWLAGVSGLLDELGREIRAELGRDPDVGDLLLVIACARPSLAGHALQGLGVDLDALWGSLEHIRQQRAEEHGSLAKRIDEIRAQKQEALESQNYEQAAKFRDEERALTQELRSGEGLDPGALDEIRRRLGLTGRDKPVAESQ